MSSEVLSGLLGGLLRGEAGRGGEAQLLVVNVFEGVVEGAVVGRDNFCHCLVQD